MKDVVIVGMFKDYSEERRCNSSACLKTIVKKDVVIVGMFKDYSEERRCNSRHV